MASEHEFQHTNEPTWCTACGEFRENTYPGEPCHGTPGAFDSRTEAGRDRIICCLVGSSAPPAAGEA